MKAEWRNQTCTQCGRKWYTNAKVWSDLCRDCRIAAVHPTIPLMTDYTPGEREAYCRGRLAAAVDANDRAAIMALGAILDDLREAGSSG